MGDISPAVWDRIADLPKSALLLNEAKNGAELIAPYLANLAPGAKVLEVGSGPAILLAHLTAAHPHLSITGIEPIGPGFAASEPFIARLSAAFPIDIRRIGYEELSGDDLFDLMFCVNVFEHLPDWRHFLTFVEHRLRVGGHCVVLCPNYSFPYESHFGIPILGNKAITGKAFKRHIERHEDANNAHGLWESLNFVTTRELEDMLQNMKFETRFDSGILGHLVGRLDRDAEFRKRQRRLSSAAKLAKRLGLAKLASADAFRRFQPYIHLDLKRIADARDRS